MFTLTDAYIANGKKDFILKREAQIRLHRLVLEELTKIKELISAFDGKVINKRLLTAYEQQGLQSHASFDYNGTLRLKIFYIGQAREIYENGKFKGYVSEDTFTFLLATQDDNKTRLDALKTIDNITAFGNRLTKNIAYMEDCITNFDKYMQQGREIEALIEKYRRNVPYDAALNITISRP